MYISRFRLICDKFPNKILAQNQQYFIRCTCGFSSSSDKNYNNFNFDSSNKNKKFAKTVGIASGILLGSYVVWNKFYNSTLKAASQNLKDENDPDKINSKLPFYSSSEVSQHYEKERRIWVTFKNGVYDVTEFVEKHPGGNRILMAAGGSLEPFWDLYPVHQRGDVFEILQKLRIGNLSEKDVYKEEAVDAFKNEPKRHTLFIKRAQKPFNGETPPSILAEKFYTPNDIFYIRNHLPVPEIDIKEYKLEVEGINIPKLNSFSLDQIKKFQKIEISATIQCGGNRRSEMGKVKQVAGLSWTGGAIGNAKWGGTRLKDILNSSGFKMDSYKNPEKIHVQFEGYDCDPSGESYGSSVPLSYILDGNFEAVLAYEMNGKPIPLDHGYPLRIVLPGIVGARSVKWINRIIISDQESQSPWQQRDYKVFSPSVTMDTVDFNSSPAIQDTPVTSYICSHEDSQVVKKGLNTFNGYAFSGGGRKIIRVEISIDQGKTWEEGKISEKDDSGSRNWSWVLWEAQIDLKKGENEIWVKAVDSGYNQQPENLQTIWNYRGLLSTGFHKIKINAI